METLNAKNVIIGAGAMGSAAAYHFARRGEPVVLIEQFALGHDRGSSHGHARITRHSYADPDYARLMPAAFRAWKELEADAGETVFFRTGGVSFSPRGVDYAGKVSANLAELGIPHWRSSGKAWNARYPAYSLPEDYDVVFEPDAGMLAAARAVALMVSLARQHGGERTQVLEQTPVRRIDLDGERPVIVTDSARIRADRLIVSAGAWVKQLLPELAVALDVTRQQVLYVRPLELTPFDLGRFPVFIYKGAAEEDAFYGMPLFLGSGVKVARHGGPVVDPDDLDRTPSELAIATVRKFLGSHIPKLATAQISQMEVCLYTVAPGEQFQVDFLPGRPDVLVASPCSGHGFKFSCLIGRVLAELAISGETEVAIGPWKSELAAVAESQLRPPESSPN
jgi:sarcosine oxidase